MSKQDFPQTELQEKIADFWSVRGYSKVMAILGNSNVSFHREQPRYEQNGLSYQYLEQFWLAAKKEVLDDYKKRTKELRKDKGGLGIMTALNIEMEEKHTKGSFDDLLDEFKKRYDHE